MKIIQRIKAYFQKRRLNKDVKQICGRMGQNVGFHVEGENESRTTKQTVGNK